MTGVQTCALPISAVVTFARLNCPRPSACAPALQRAPSSASKGSRKPRAGGAAWAVAGTSAIVEHGPRLDLKGEWSDFRWPLAGHDPAVRSPAAAFTLSGVLPYQVQLRGRGRAAELPEMTLEASGTLGKDGVTFEPAEVGLFEGHASVNGKVLWSPAESWSVSGRATGINPAQLRADLPGSVNFAFAADGHGFDPHGELSVSFSDISGRLRGLAASGIGTLTHSGTTWGFSNVRVGLGTATLALDGRVSEQLDLRFALSVHDLSLLAPQAQGELKASGAVSGTLAEPAIVASAHGANFAWQGATLKALDAEINFNPAASTQESNIDARLR